MTGGFFVKIVEHNNWASQQLIQVSAKPSEAQLNAQPQSATIGRFHATLLHLVSAQSGYLSLLTLPVAKRMEPPLKFAGLKEAARISGKRWLNLARAEGSKSFEKQIQTKDGFLVAPWVVIVQAINHESEHREQIKSMISAMGLTPPDIDGWTYGVVAKAMMPTTKD